MSASGIQLLFVNFVEKLHIYLFFPQSSQIKPEGIITTRTDLDRLRSTQIDSNRLRSTQIDSDRLRF